MPAALQPIIDISLLGDKELERKLAGLADKLQRKVVRTALHKTLNKIVKKEIVRRLSGHPVQSKTGRLRAAMKRGRVRSSAGRKARRTIARAIPLPPREELGIDPDDKFYYPAAVEYGHGNVPPKSFLRAAVDDNEERIKKHLARLIGEGIEREAARGK